MTCHLLRPLAASGVRMNKKWCLPLVELCDGQLSAVVVKNFGNVTDDAMWGFDDLGVILSYIL